MIASVTRLRVRSIWYLPAFVWRTFLAQRQVVHAAGFAGGRLLVDSDRTFWALTGWENEQAMKRFRSSGAHAAVMPKLTHWCDEASYAHWSQEGSAVPNWLEAYERLLAEGRLSPVTNPSSNHQARLFRQPRLKPAIGQDLKPA